MNPTICLALTGLGGVIVLISFFLPWVSLDSGPIPLSLLTPIIQTLSPQIGALVEQIIGIIYVSGYNAAFSYTFLPGIMRILPLVPVGFVLVAGLCLGLSAVSLLLPRVANGIVAVGGLIIFIVLIVSISQLNVLGYRADPLLSTALSVLGFGVTTGFWGTLIGLLLMTVGAGICLTTQKRGSEDESFDYLGYQ
jgi:uncharacterized membrane protein